MSQIHYVDAIKINTNINQGKVTFNVNGKTLKDVNGKVIYAKVVNGTEQLKTTWYQKIEKKKVQQSKQYTQNQHN